MTASVRLQDQWGSDLFINSSIKDKNLQIQNLRQKKQTDYINIELIRNDRDGITPAFSKPSTKNY